MKSVLHTATALSALLWAGAAMAGDSAAIDAVVVTANRAPMRIDRVGGQITLIGPEAIRQSQAVILSDLLARTPGVTFTRNGGVGAATQLRIRGAETDQTVVLIDGVKLNDPSSTGGGYNFANLLVGDVERIEVLRGAQSVLWGSQALGGVVNVITADAKTPFEGDLDAEAGSLGTGYVRAGAGGRSDRVIWRAAAARYVTDGVSAFDKARGGREADGYRNTGASAKARIILGPQASIDLRGVYSDGRNDFDGFPPPLFAFADTSEYGTTRDAVGYAGLNLDLLDGRLKNRLAYAYTGTDRHNFNPAQAVTTHTFDSTGRNGRWEYQGTLQATRDWSAVFGAETERSSFRSASPSAFAPHPVAARRGVGLTGIYAQVVGQAAPGLTLAAGLRRDDHDTFGQSTVGQASAAYALGTGTILRVSWGQGFKAPTLYQLYGDYGNTGLAPERADSWDAGIEQHLAGGRATLQGAYFSRDTSSQIDFVSCTAATPLAGCTAPSGVRRFGFYSNIASASAHGVELQGRATLAEGLELSANYSWTHAINTSAGNPNNGKRLARRPDNAANAQLSYLWPVRLTTSIAVRYAGDSFDDAANRTRLKGYTLTDLRASYPLTGRLEVYGRIENLGDVRYETILNYGEPGRTATVGLRARF